MMAVRFALWGMWGLIAVGGLAVMAAPSTARAWEPQWRSGRAHHGDPLVWRADPPPRHPRRYHLTGSGTRTRTHVRVHVRRRSPRKVVVREQKSDYDGPFERDPYDNDGLVVVGAGAGGLIALGGRTEVAPLWRLHLGLALEQAEFGLSFGLAPDAMRVPVSSRAEMNASLYRIGAGFNYRFLRDAVVHPVAGAGLGALILSPSQHPSGTAFAANARAGLEFAYPLSDGALALGLDVTGHLPFAATEEYAVDAEPLLSFGTYLNYRF